MADIGLLRPTVVGEPLQRGRANGLGAVRRRLRVAGVVQHPQQHVGAARLRLQVGPAIVHSCKSQSLLIGRFRYIAWLGEMPIQSCGQSFSAPRGKAGARLNAHTELPTMRQRSER